MKQRLQSNSPRMIGINEVTEFITQESPKLTPPRIKMKAKQFYVFLFDFAAKGKLNLYFVCIECSKEVGTCRCSGYTLRGTWFYHRMPQEVAWRWKVSVESLLNLSEVQISPLHIQTATRVRGFVEYLKATSK